MSSDAAPRRFWETAATRLAARINFSAWLDAFAPGAFAASSAAATALYALRRVHGPVGWGAIALGLALAIAALIAWRLARRRFFTHADARVLLEHHLRLDAALSAATAQVAPWPAPAPLPPVLRWRAPRTLGWIAGALALVAASLWLPVPALTDVSARPTEKPPSLAQTEAWLREAAQLNPIDPASVAALEKRAQELADKPPEQQYTHSGLEAADTLRAQTAAALTELARNFDKAADSLAPLTDSTAAPLSEAQLGSLAQNLSAALHGLGEGQLTANPALLQQLSATAAQGLGQLSPAQAAQLANQLGAAGAGARGVLGAAGAGASVGGGLPGWNQRGNSPGSGGAPGSGLGGGPGNGGPGGGGTTAPLTFGNSRSNVGDGTAQGLSSSDLSRATLGDLIETTRGTPDNDPSKAVGPTSAGAIAAPASGGEAVWVDRLTPAERAVLKNFFK